MELQWFGVRVFKVYMCVFSFGYLWLDDVFLLECFECFEAFDVLLIVHVENDLLLQVGLVWMVVEGCIDLFVHVDSCLLLVEIEVIARVVRFVFVIGTWLHVVHVFMFEGVEIVCAVKVAGVCVMCEMCL